MNNMFSKFIIAHISFISVNIFGSFGPPQQNLYIKDGFSISCFPAMFNVHLQNALWRGVEVSGRAETINRSVSFKLGEVLPFPCLDDGKVVFLF